MTPKYNVQLQNREKINIFNLHIVTTKKLLTVILRKNIQSAD